MRKNRITLINLIIFFIFILSGCNNSTPSELNQTTTVSPTPTTVSPTPTTASPTPTPESILIGSFSTKILDDEKNRVNNIFLAVKKINGVVVKSGESFSFNNTLGEIDSSDGYKKAPVIINGEKSIDVGGGICQLSSTLYNAVIKAGLEITERHPHDKKVPYLPNGNDATVAFGLKDFKFKNNKDFPVKIIAAIKGKELKTSLQKNGL